MIQGFLDGLSVYLHSSLLLSYLTVYLGGVLVSFTPCVYPVAPITVAVIGAYGNDTRSKGFLLSLVYVLGMALTYTFLGAGAALSGRLFGQIQSNPLTYFIMANICILMGLSMLGVFTFMIRTPQILSRVELSGKTKGVSRIFLVGMASGFIMGPCTTPVLTVLLGYVATQQRILFGMSLLFVFAFGMGTLLIILGTFAGIFASIPKGGVWMTRVSRLFGWILLGTGEYLLLTAGALWG